MMREDGMDERNLGKVSGRGVGGRMPVNMIVHVMVKTIPFSVAHAIHNATSEL